AAKLVTAGRQVRVAIPEDHKDWNDALRDPKADLEALRRAILHAPLQKRQARVESVGMIEFMSLKFPPRQFLLKPWLTTTGLAMIHAQPGHCKTWLALSIGYSVASQKIKTLLGWPKKRSGRVLYVDGELPGEVLQRRIKALGPQLPDTDFRVLAQAQFAAREQMMIDIGTEEGRDALDTEIEVHGIDLIILDSVTTLVRSGTDNDVESWRAIQTWSLKHRARGRSVLY